MPVPTGVALRDAREQLFAAAERVLFRDGPHALTSRAVTDEAGCAKGVLHRHFTDFDGFLAELILDRIARIDEQARALCRSAGTGTVTANLAAALAELFEPVAVAVVALVISRDELRARLLQARSERGLPLLGEATGMVAAYLTAERDLGRLDADAAIDALAPTLVGAGHLLFADRTGTPPEHQVLRKMVGEILGAGD